MMQKKRTNRAKRSLGQNFLVDGNYQNKIIDVVKNKYNSETILEIGPGHGALTQHLVSFAKKLILVEKDFVLAKNLQEKFADHDHVSVVQADFLKWELPPINEIIVVANLPYNVASQILIQIFKHSAHYKALYIMLQKEMALRAIAHPGTKDFSVFSIWCQLFSQPQKLFHLPPTAFSPKPKVTSTFLELCISPCDYNEQKDFIFFIKKLFNQRRKKISTTLKSSGILSQNLSDAIREKMDKRAEALSISELKELFGDLKDFI
jgi:16S rRNA (adenine1518-N6/adenine1519-N6)-dimethyltransferase